jgi:predicted SAM-dependent methyltransferase
MPPDDLASRIEEFLLSLDLPADGRDYLDRHLRRLVQTLLRVPQSRSSGRALELGSYMHMAPVLHLFLGYRDVRGAYYGHAGESKTLASSVGGREVFRCVIDGFDVERDRFPYDDESMETVLACEIIEHLLSDPIHMLSEIHRVLELGGTMVLTTPNVVSYTSLARALTMERNPQIYSSYPPLKEDEADVEIPHVREYTPEEIEETVRAAGFTDVTLETERDETFDSEWVERILREQGLPTERRGEQQYCVARKTAPHAAPQRPHFLYDQ